MMPLFTFTPKFTPKTFDLVKIRRERRTIAAAKDRVKSILIGTSDYVHFSQSFFHIKPELFLIVLHVTIP